ncbi:fluoride efflux transporter FluC [Symbiobacterium thermophilum]|uniref:Fluoride-specific ion channel FluC n=1 Tax=Symbiobacterium thermophilum TaxID=2734 RepID=A0A953LJW1_SYMTR|nr:CrcB family protein [Symbiobacterium thermophilum]MBY6276322.1 fluoride efflux transporter CrcB [Symbiobacterium thermophilum]
MSWILLGVAGAAGAVARLLVGGWARGRSGPRPFPWGTFAVNVTGAFLLGLVTGLGTGRGLLSAEVKLVLGTGFLGAYTTFSTWQLDLYQALRRGDATTALLNLALSAGLGLLAAWTGLAVGWGR